MALRRIKPRKTPTFKQKLFATKYIEHKGNGTQAAIESYDADYKNAQAIAYQNNHNPVVEREIKKQLDEAGLSTAYLNQKSKRIVDEIHEDEALNPKTVGVATNHLQFLYKLHNTLPMNKSMRMNLNMSQDLTQINVVDATKTLKELDSTTKALLKELQS